MEGGGGGRYKDWREEKEERDLFCNFQTSEWMWYVNIRSQFSERNNILLLGKINEVASVLYSPIPIHTHYVTHTKQYIRLCHTICKAFRIISFSPFVTEGFGVWVNEYILRVRMIGKQRGTRDLPRLKKNTPSGPSIQSITQQIASKGVLSMVGTKWKATQ